MRTSVQSAYSDFIIPSYGRLNLVIERGSGCRVWDDQGREYLDFGAGIAVCSLGHSHPRVTAAVADQAGRLVHTSNLYYTHPQAELAERLITATGAPGKVFFCNSGAEANEGLIKTARRFGSKTGRHHIITFRGSFHGRTMAGISATGQEKVKVDFGPLLDGFSHVTFNDLEAVRSAMTNQTVAILIEPVQGESGIHPAHADFLRGLRRLCDEHNLLLFFDEIQCGLGRTGDWCGWRSIAPDVEPDGVSWAKGIANGFPLGAFWIRQSARDDRGNLCDLLGPGSHATTYGGNPVCCAAGVAVHDEIVEKELLAAAREGGQFLVDSLRSLQSPLIKEIRGLGLMIGIQLADDAKAQIGNETTDLPSIALTKHLLAKGLLVVPAGEATIRLLPPLNTPREDLQAALDRLSGVK